MEHVCIMRSPGKDSLWCSAMSSPATTGAGSPRCDSSRGVIVSSLITIAVIRPRMSQQPLRNLSERPPLYPKILEMTTTCGHGMISLSLAGRRVKALRNGKLRSEEASAELAKPCMGGIFNTRCARILMKEDGPATRGGKEQPGSKRFALTATPDPLSRTMN
jgi:hypothetical protein